MKERIKMEKENLTQATEMNTLIDYQNDAVVSRTLLKKQAGTITLFAFDKGQALSEHTAPFDAMVHIIDGKADINIDGKKHEVKVGQAIIMPAKITHAIHAAEQFKMLLIMIKSQ